MRISIVGLRNAGKTTFFNLVTSHGMEGSASGKKGLPIGTANIKDPRLDLLTQVYNPKKTVPAKIEFIDTPALDADSRGNSLSGDALDQVKRGDALCLLIQQFDSPYAPHPQGSIDGMRDLTFIMSEFIMTDLILLERRQQRLKKEVTAGKDPNKRHELDAIEKALSALEAEQRLISLEWSEQERKLLSPYQLLTLKPLLIVINIGEDNIAELDDVIQPYASAFPDCTVTGISAATELELAQMEPEDAQEFMAELGIQQTAFDRVLHAAFNLLDLKVFFTAGEDECRAWPVPASATAEECAGAIHSDLQRGFIRALVLPFSEFEANPAPQTFKAKARQEKKNYLVNDGDIIEVLFSV